MKYYLLFLLSITIPVFAHADCPEDSKEAYKKILNRAEKSGLPGVLYYYQNDSCVIQLAKGSSDLATQTVLEKNDRFIVGSITKTFISVSSVKLAKAGIFNLDDNLEKWLPVEITSRIPKSDIITIRHLLSHTSGIFDYLNDSSEYITTLIADPLRQRTELEAFAFAADKPLHFEPGTEFRYSNTGYLLMGLIINNATNQHYTSVIREQILEPLELSNSFHLAEPIENQLEYVHGYTEMNNGLVDTHDVIPNIAFSDGGMVSTVQNLSKFIQAIFTNKSFMDDKLLATLLSSPVKDSEMFLGIAVSDLFFESSYKFGHNGSFPGYLSSLYFIPGTNETIVTFSNGNSGSTALNLFNASFMAELIRERIQTKRGKLNLVPLI